MSFKDYMITTLHKLYRKDEWLQELFRVAGLKLDEVEATVDEIHGNNFFDTATEKAILQYENELNIKASVNDYIIGPCVTRYEIVPEIGVRVSSIVNIQNDLNKFAK